MGEDGEKTGKFHRRIIDLCILFTGGNGRNCRFLTAVDGFTTGRA